MSGMSVRVRVVGSGFGAWGSHAIDALRWMFGAAPDCAPTFADGLACVRVFDALRGVGS